MKTPASPVLDSKTIVDLPLDGNKLIEASAGTGKTHTICNLFLRHVLNGKTVDQILVVTFTNAATEELRGRIRNRLWLALQALESGKPGYDPLLEKLLEPAQKPEQQSIIQRSTSPHSQAHDALQLAVRSMDESAIYTIHGFCQRILADHLLNCGGDFGQRQINSDTLLWQQALADWWRLNTYPLSAGEVAFVLQSLRSFDAFSVLQKPLRHQLFTGLLPHSERTLQELLENYRSLEPAVKKLAAQWQTEREPLTGILYQSPALSRGPYKDSLLNPALAHLDRYFSSAELLPVCKDFVLLTTDHLTANSKPKKRHSDPALDHPFFVSCNRLQQQLDTIQKFVLTRALFEASVYARKQVTHEQQKLQTMDFPDLLSEVHKALTGPLAETLIEQLQRQYPVAMIDEFQDTDSLQYAIFDTLYHNHHGTALTLIGDPKQAIYGFRGGDIFSYIQARENPDLQRYTLDSNWRSTPALIEAVNCIFSRRPDPFVFHQAITFERVKPGGVPTQQSQQCGLCESGNEASALTLWQIPRSNETTKNGQGKFLVGVDEIVARTTAAEIARLLAGASEGNITLGGIPLQASDIAVLVRTREQGNQVRQALQTYHIRAVTISRDSVFDSAEAQGLLRVLEAVLTPQNHRLVRSALTSSLFDLTYDQIAKQLNQETSWLSWLQQLQELQRLWLQHGFMAMFLRLLQCQDMGQRLAAKSTAERKLTNLLHLAELLQQAAKSHHGMLPLYHWFVEQIQNQSENNSSNEAELRLESDASLVHIVTIHASKGLEYNVVFLPYLWNYQASRRSNTLLRLHDDDNKPLLALAEYLDPQQYCRAEKERLAEDIRLAYVALTRARVKVYMAWGSALKKSAGTALAYLLHPNQSAEALDHNLPGAFETPEQVTADLQQLEQAARGTIEITPLPVDPPSPENNPTLSQHILLTTAKFSRQFDKPWRIASFSSLTRDIHQPTIADTATTVATDPILGFPAGSIVGTFLHRVLEQLNFCDNIEQQTLTLCHQEMASQPFDNPHNRQLVSNWLVNVVETSLNHQNLKLRDIASSVCLREMPFDYAVTDLDMSALQQHLQTHAGESLLAPDSQHLRGLMTGVIDLVFKHGERYYIVDYKSNFLGPQLSDYGPQQLQKAIYQRRYDLQYMLYTIALHRYLRFRINDYQYSAHFGGIYYLFIRGMRPETGPDNGVYYFLPPQQLVETLDQTIGVTDKSGCFPC